MAAHTMFDGRLQIYKRENGRFWSCAARVGGQRFRQTTSEEALDRAKDVAEDWYLDLRGKLRAGQIVSSVSKEKTFGAAAESYLSEVRVLAASVRSPKYISLMELRMNAHVLPFFKDKPLAAINKGMVQTYRVKRAEQTIEKTATKGEDGAPDSLRHSYISMRLMEGANIHQIANNCRTSVQMIEQFYAAHIKDRLDASAINVMRPKAARKAARKSAPKDQSAPGTHR